MWEIIELVFLGVSSIKLWITKIKAALCQVLMIWITAHKPQWSLINSSPPSAAFMHQWSGLALVQVMACRLIGAKPLSEPMLTYYQWDPWEQASVKFESKYKILHLRKYTWKCRLRNGGQIVHGSIVHGQFPTKKSPYTSHSLPVRVDWFLYDVFCEFVVRSNFYLCR